MNKKSKSAYSVFLFLFLSLIATVYFLLQPIDRNYIGESVVFNIESGTSVDTVIKKLKSLDLIRSTRLAYIYVRLSKIGIKSGSYKLSKCWDTIKILNELNKGTQELVKVTIPEGLTLDKTAQLFDDLGLVSKGEFLKLASSDEILSEFNIPAKTCEGYLFPDTYLFGKNDSPKTVITTIIDNFFQKISTISGIKTDPEILFNTLRLASIVEREYRLDSEAGKIAGVFANRLKIGMGLQSCATVEYIITEIQHKKHPTRLFNIDLEINNPYNTYMYSGLPPGPISNPGLIALNAATNPEKHDYLFFRLIDVNNGRHAFSKTLYEHNNTGNNIILKRAAGK